MPRILEYPRMPFDFVGMEDEAFQQLGGKEWWVQILKKPPVGKVEEISVSVYVLGITTYNHVQLVFVMGKIDTQLFGRPILKGDPGTTSLYQLIRLEPWISTCRICVYGLEMR